MPTRNLICNTKIPFLETFLKKPKKGSRNKIVSDRDLFTYLKENTLFSVKEI